MSDEEMICQTNLSAIREGERTDQNTVTSIGKLMPRLHSATIGSLTIVDIVIGYL